MDDDPLFRLFVENSKLGPRTARAYAARLEADDRAPHEATPVAYARTTPLLAEVDPLSSLMEARRSARAFGASGLTERELSRLFGAWALGLLPSAGGRYPVEVYAYCLRVEGPLAGHVVHYDRPAHAASLVCACPPFSSCAEELGLTGASEPAVVFVFVAFPSRTTRRYGERGGRFVLIEVGQYAQNLALRLAHEGLAGYELGGLHDDEVRRRLGLERTDALVALGFACGRRA